MGLIPESGRSSGGGNGNPCQDSCQDNPMGRGAWWTQSMGLQSVGCGSEAEYMRAHVQTLSCAYGIPVPGPVMEPQPPALGAHSLCH